jgi:hypothetical protein
VNRLPGKYGRNRRTKDPNQSNQQKTSSHQASKRSERV